MVVLSDCPQEHEFWVCDDRMLKNMSQLAKALKDMDNGVFSAHSNKEKTDFSNWVGDILGDEKLAKSLEKNKSQQHAYKKVRARLTFLNTLKKGKKKK